MGEIEKATALPWEASPSGAEPQYLTYVQSAVSGEQVCEIPDVYDEAGRAQANAALIVRAVNNHDALVAALRGLRTGCIERVGDRQMCLPCGGDGPLDGDILHTSTCPVRVAEAALAAVEGETT